MRIVMVAPGTRGDVAPMAGLASRLKSEGHSVVIVADAPYESIVTRSGSAVEAIPADLRAAIAGTDGSRNDGSPRGVSPAVIREQLSRLREYMDIAATATLAAARGADVVLANSVSPFAHDIAEGLGIPSLGTFLQPVEPSADYAPVLLGTGRSFGRLGNRLLGTVMRDVGAPSDAVCARMRRELGLRKESRRTSERRRRRSGLPIVHGISPAVFPRPGDWRPELTLAGYWWPLQQAVWSPPTELVDFLDAGPRPVFIGFGSAAAGTATATLVADAVRRAGARAVVQGDGYAGISGDDILTVGEVPHEWLFDRVAAVVHHAGAGTTAAGLRARLPTVAVPQFTDQPLWGRRIAALGAGPAPIPAKSLTAEKLASAIADAVGNPSYRERARIVAREIARDDGAAGVLAELERLH